MSAPYIPSIPTKPYSQMYKIVNRSTIHTKNLRKSPIYRMFLSEIFVDFSSEYGKLLFREALLNGHMECYFVLAAQFRTQDEPTFCGVSTLVMVLNTLLVDPGMVWKDVWKWYHESMLDCCLPIEVMLQTGVTLEEFVRMANLNNLDTDAVWVTDDSSLHTFREVVKKYTQRDDVIIVCHYSRALLDQKGGGHFTTIGGYHEGTDKLLILDVARYKYPPHWADVSMLFDAMKGIDPFCGLSRGYVLLKRRQPVALHQDTCYRDNTISLHDSNNRFPNNNTISSTYDSDSMTSLSPSNSECFQYILDTQTDEPFVLDTHSHIDSNSGSHSPHDSQSESE